MGGEQDHFGAAFVVVVAFKIGAERRAGELLGRMELKAGRPKAGNASTLKALGVGELQSHRWQTMAAVPDAEVKRLEAEVGAEENG